ncbi:hypothetical protein M404DRAFT_162790, partial [Pisolithus tinctorius Marx 270]
TLTLVTDDHLAFRSSNSAGVWATTTPKGNQYEFNDTVQGVVMRCYLEPITGLSEENFALMVEDIQTYVEKGTVTSSAMGLGEDDSEYEDLFTFH